MAKTAMATALAKAGIKSTKDRIGDLAEAAVSKHPRNLDMAAHALFYALLKDEDAALEVLFRPSLPALSSLINGAAKAKALTRGGGRAGQGVVAAPAAIARPANNPPRGGAAIASVSKVVALAYLSRDTAVGKRLGDCNREDLQSMARTDRHRAWLYDALATPMPPTGKVADFYSDEQVAEIDRKWNAS